MTISQEVADTIQPEYVAGQTVEESLRKRAAQLNIDLQDQTQYIREELFMDFSEEIELIEENGITPDIMRKIIEKHLPKAEDMKQKYNRYRGVDTGVPIYDRELPTGRDVKVNNKLNNDFFSEIIDTKVGYGFGNPVKIVLDTSARNHKGVVDMIQQFQVMNNLDDMNGQTCKMAAICGYDAWLLYTDKDANRRIMRINPWEAVILSRREITMPEFSVRYFIRYDKQWHAEFYDGTEKVIFRGDGYGSLEEYSREPHYCIDVPLLGIPNNTEMLGDADKQLNLIDAYNRCVSDLTSEVEQFRLAYMIAMNCDFDEDIIAMLRKTGLLQIESDPNRPASVSYLEKTLDINAVTKVMEVLEENIIRFSGHVDMTDEAFAGNLSGVAIKYKLTKLENKMKYFELKHKAAMWHVFKILAAAWRIDSMDFNYTYLTFKYTRNIPVNILDEASAANALAGIVSKRTQLGMLSVVDDVDDEEAQIEKEEQSKAYMQPGGSPAIEVDDEQDNEDEQTEDDPVSGGEE